MIMLQVAAALGLLNVWLLRFNRGTAYRGGNADTMQGEFAAYGLPPWSVYVVGTLKVSAALALVVGIWVPALVWPAAILVSLLMVGALAMHLKIRDPLVKSVPAVAMLAVTLTICWGSLR